MNVNDEIQVRIESIAFGGAGVARVNDMVLFVNFVIPGEEVLVKIIKKHPTYAEAKLIEITEPSEIRIDPVCRYFSICGGCVYQHIPYAKQLEIKKKQISELFERIAGQDDIFVDDVCPSPQDLNYRTKIRMKYKKCPDGYKFGYFDFFQNNMVDIESCSIASKPLNDFLAHVRSKDFEFFRKRRVKSYNLSFMEGDRDGIITNLEPAKDIHTIVQGKDFHYGRDSFFQINRSIFTPLFENIFKILKERQISGGTLLDLYCGVGFFGIVLSDLFRKVQFIEENKKSYEYLLKNISANGIEDIAETFCSKADRVIDDLSEKPDVVLMDPPRAGSTPYSITQVSGMNPSVIIYISCNPATQARDIKLFSELGYKAEYVKPFDFFPQTKHVESMAVLVNKNERTN